MARKDLLPKMSFTMPNLDETTTKNIKKIQRPNAVMVFSSNQSKKEKNIIIDENPVTENIKDSPLKCARRETLTIDCYVDGCGKPFKSKTSLENHMWNWHRKEKTEPCPECGKMFITTKGIRDHLRASHGYKKRKCDVLKCKFSCLYYNQMYIHKKQVHLKKTKGNQSKSKKCEEQGCEESFKETTGLEDHLRNAHGYQELECGLAGCCAKFKQTKEFRKHRNEVHGSLR